MPSLNDVKELGNWFVGLVVAIGFAISHIRVDRKKSDTDIAVEEARQDSARIYVDQSHALEARIEAERKRADAAAVACEAREEHLRGINESLKLRFEGAFSEIEGKVKEANESAFYWRDEALTAQRDAATEKRRADDFLIQIEQNRLTFEWQQQVWRNRYGNIFERFRILVNEKYGDGTMTNIAGEGGSLVDESELPIPPRPKDFA